MANINQVDQTARREAVQSPNIIQQTKTVKFPRVRRAKVQGTPTSGSVISVKLLDSGSHVTGGAFNVFALPTRTSIDFSKYFPPISNEQIINIAECNDNCWYLQSPNIFFVDKW